MLDTSARLRLSFSLLTSLSSCLRPGVVSEARSTPEEEGKDGTGGC